jgi:hypothetical protein
MKATTKPKVFLSYAREDFASAERMARDLDRQGVSVWFDKTNLLGGDDWERSIRQAIESSDYFVALLSRTSVSKVGTVQKEVKFALDILDQFPEGRVFLVPVRLDECKTSYERIQKLHRIDMFPSWKNGIKDISRAVGNGRSPVNADELLKMVGAGQLTRNVEEPFVRTTVLLPSAVKGALDRISMGRSRAEVITEAVKSFLLDRNSKPGEPDLSLYLSRETDKR